MDIYNMCLKIIFFKYIVQEKGVGGGEFSY